MKNPEKRDFKKVVGEMKVFNKKGTNVNVHF